MILTINDDYRIRHTDKGWTTEYQGEEVEIHRSLYQAVRSLKREIYIKPSITPAFVHVVERLSQ